MLHQRWFIYVQPVVIIGALLLLAACSPAATTQTGSPAATATTAPTATATTAPPTATATLTPPNCPSAFTGPYVATLPDATFPETNVYAQVQLPPLTRSWDDDASGGFRGRRMCSGGTTASVESFMAEHLTNLGWQQIRNDDPSCVTVLPDYIQGQCWKNGMYALFVGINTNLDWLITFQDPSFK